MQEFRAKDYYTWMTDFEEEADLFLIKNYYNRTSKKKAVKPYTQALRLMMWSDLF